MQATLPSSFLGLEVNNVHTESLMKIIEQRMTATNESDVVVFLIGMRINRWWKVHQWARVAAAMPRMLRELEANPELGYLGGEAWFGRTTLLMSYWKSTEHLMRYAKMRDAEHLPAWRAFNKRVGTRGDVGVWHETYRVSAGAYETVYVNMPAFGLGRTRPLVEARGRHAEAAGRLAAAAPVETAKAA